MKQKMAKEAGFHDAKQIGEWNGYEVVEPIFTDGEVHYVGLLVYHSLRSTCKACSIDFPFQTSEEIPDYIDTEEAIYRDNWERVRFLALCLLTPYQKKGKRLKGTDLIRFPWGFVIRRCSFERVGAGAYQPYVRCLVFFVVVVFESG